MPKPSFREVTVKQTQRLTQNMQRVTLTGPSLQEFPTTANGGYIKLLFKPSGEALKNTSDYEALDGQRPVLRTYTVRSFDPATLLLDVDFALHGEDQHGGPASAWSRQCQPGDTLLIGGPGPVKLINDQADWYFLAGDMTALPAISHNLEQMPEDAKGYAVISIISEADKQELKKPQGIELIWVVDADNLAAIVKQQPWQEGQVAVWVACEFSVMRELRDYFKKEKSVERDFIYISSYWKQGNTEDQHKLVKREDAESQED